MTTATGPRPRTGNFLRRTIPTSDTTGHYVPLAAETRADHHQPGTAGPATWPVRLTRCGEHPGTFGDNRPMQRLQAAR